MKMNTCIYVIIEYVRVNFDLPLAILKALPIFSNLSSVGGSVISLVESLIKMMYLIADDPQCGHEPSLETG